MNHLEEYLVDEDFGKVASELLKISYDDKIGQKEWESSEWRLNEEEVELLGTSRGKEFEEQLGNKDLLMRIREEIMSNFEEQEFLSNYIEWYIREN